MAVNAQNQFKPFWRHIKGYFRSYGGWKSVLGSPLFVAAVLITAVSYRQWLAPEWTEAAYSLLPSLLGFSLGTYALLFSLITARVKGAMRAIKNDEAISLLEQVNATFFHYIFVQVVGLVWAFLFSGNLFFDVATWLRPQAELVWCAFSLMRTLGSFFGFLLMVYSVTLIVAAAMAIYRLALIADPIEENR
ncbi:hypothetical protein [Erythrobacter sp. R86502]|uniref:hypothetical protein n=1 Tax=Erythrobacter sp. R86502 TaxID=3093846 RepID=UPI0036D40C10